MWKVEDEVALLHRELIREHINFNTWEDPETENWACILIEIYSCFIYHLTWMPGMWKEGLSENLLPPQSEINDFYF